MDLTIPNSNININIDLLCTIAQDAGAAIMEIYNTPIEKFEISFKKDQSPLTIADKVSHEIISTQLSSAYPDIPIMSEEGKDIPYEVRKDWGIYWCIDPLDGTKEFIKKNGEFTVNIALIYQNKPICGVINIPVSETTYFAVLGKGAWKMHNKEAAKEIKVNKLVDDWTAIGSRSHSSEEEENILAQFPVTEKISVGSSIKFCYIAEGKAQLYCRVGPTMEWDTAAGQIIAECGGAKMTTVDGEIFHYNKTSLLNPGFICEVI